MDNFCSKVGSGVSQGDAVWVRAGVCRRVSYSIPLAIPYQSVGARELTCKPYPLACAHDFVLAAAGLQLPTPASGLGSGVKITRFSSDISSRVQLRPTPRW